MSIWAMRYVWKSDVPRHLKLVLLKIAYHTDSNGRCSFPAVRSIARECGLHERTVRKYLRQLRELGVIEIMVPHDPIDKIPTTYEIVPLKLHMLSFRQKTLESKTRTPAPGYTEPLSSDGRYPCPERQI